MKGISPSNFRLPSFPVILSEVEGPSTPNALHTMSREYDFFVYMVTNYSGSVLYIGTTNDLPRRVWEHQHAQESSEFTKQYHVDRLVFFEHYGDVRDAIAREKQLKGWTRAKKEALIRTMNPQREDLTCQLDPNWRREPLQGGKRPGAAEVEGPSTSLRMTRDARRMTRDARRMTKDARRMTKDARRMTE